MALVLILIAPAAKATPTLRLTAGGNSITIADGSVLDGSTVAGVVAYFGGLGGFSFIVGVTNPSSGSASNPLLTLNQVTVLGGSGTLTIEFSDNNFSPISDSTLFASIGGTTNSSVSYSTYWDPSNALFGTANLVTSQGTFTGSANGSHSFGGSQNGGDAQGFLSAGSNFSLTQRIVIERGSGPDTTGFNATLSATSVPDGGATLALLGFSMVGLAGAMRILGRGAR